MPSDSVRIGSIYGISIELHWIFILITIFFLIDPLFDAIWILLFICVLIHELAHSTTALANGVKVKRIVLLPWGGASVIENDPLDPKVEFRVSIAGPLMSLFLGGIFGMISIVTPPGIIEFLVQQLFILNIFLGVLNLIPAYPMDGGRVFRSFLRMRGYDDYRSTKITIKLCMIMLVLIMVATVGLILYEAAWSTFRKELIFVLDAFVVYFLYSGARTEDDMAEIRKQAGNLTVKSVINTHFTFIEKDSDISSLYSLVKNHQPHLIVTKLDSGYAIVDIAKLEKMKNVLKVSALSIPMPSMASGTKVADAITKMMEAEGLGIAAVVNKDKLLGVITYTQIRAYISLHNLNKKAMA